MGEEELVIGSQVQVKGTKWVIWRNDEGHHEDGRDNHGERRGVPKKKESGNKKPPQVVRECLPLAPFVHQGRGSTVGQLIANTMTGYDNWKGRNI